MIVFFTARWLKRIPGFAPGILFLFLGVAASAQSLDLALELMEEGNWVGVRREALRALSEHPDHEQALLLAALAERQLRPQEIEAGRVLAHLAESSSNAQLRALAGYEYGRSCWATGDLTKAWTALSRVFQSTGDRDLFLRSGCALFLLRQQEATLGEGQDALLTQLATCRDLWTWELRDEVRVHAKRKSSRLTAKPGEWLVSFYRAQIGPAIGHRCSLYPSCSAYFLEASRAYGLAGVPLIADRLVREPGVVAAAEHPRVVGEEVRFQDPLSDHVHTDAGKGGAP